MPFELVSSWLIIQHLKLGLLPALWQVNGKAGPKLHLQSCMPEVGLSVTCIHSFHAKLAHKGINQVVNASEI